MLAVALDVSSEPSVDEAFTRVEAELGPVELLVLNAGILTKASLEDTTSEDWRRMLEVNLTGPFLCARRAVARMREAGYGRIVHRLQRRHHGPARRRRRSPRTPHPRQA